MARFGLREGCEDHAKIKHGGKDATLHVAVALGEFGATIMVAGNIPGRTTTLPVAIYYSVQSGEDSRAWTLAAVSLVIAFLALWLGEKFQRRRK